MVNQILKYKYIYVILIIVLVDIFVSYIQAKFPLLVRFGLFVGLLGITALSVPFIQSFKDRVPKVVSYLFIGFATFWIVGIAAYSSKDELVRFGEFLPVIVLAMANGIVITIALVEGYKYGYIFSGMGFSVTIYNLVTTRSLDFVGGKPDMLLLISVLWVLVPLLWCYFLADTTQQREFKAKNRLFTTIKGVFLTLPVYIALTVAVLVSQGYESFNIPSSASISNFFAQNPNLHILIAGISWFYFLSHIVVIMGVFLANELILHALDMKREISESGDIIYLKKKPKAPILQINADPYKDIIKEMKIFQREFQKGKYNRLTSIQKIGKIKNELDLLTSKYDSGSKEQAIKLMQQIEREVDFAFK